MRYELRATSYELRDVNKGTWVIQYPSPGHHAEREQQTLGASLPRSTDRGLALRAGRHADRSSGEP
jgi:hypothetical protein